MSNDQGRRRGHGLVPAALIGEIVQNRFRLQLGRFALDFDRDYGMDRRTGWTATYWGSVQAPELTTLPKALLALVRGWWRLRNYPKEK
jgi:hypothetical protein